MRRVMLKLSGEALAGDEKFGFDLKVVDSICKQIKKVKSKTTQIAIVTGATGGIGEEFIKELSSYKDIDEIWGNGRNNSCNQHIYYTECRTAGMAG